MEDMFAWSMEGEREEGRGGVSLVGRSMLYLLFIVRPVGASSFRGRKRCGPSPAGWYVITSREASTICK